MVVIQVSSFAGSIYVGQAAPFLISHKSFVMKPEPHLTSCTEI